MSRSSLSGTSVPLWETSVLREAAGDTLRPGGFSLTDRAAEAIGVVPGWHVLDVGSGLGATVARLRSRFGAQAWGVELSGNQIERAGADSHLVQARGDALPFQSGSLDAVFCECVLSLFEDAERGLKEFFRVLRPGGYLVLADLYGRESGLPGSNSCAGRAVPLFLTRSMVEACGFSVRLVEDHSPQLKELAARLLLAGEEARNQCGCDRRLGYYLMIARKQGGSHGG